MPRRSIVMFAVLVLLIAVAVGGYAWMARQAGQDQGSGVALVGGPFTLTDQDGRQVTEKTFLGKYMLVFFGFTFCPDICPTELQVMSAALDQLGPDGAAIQPVFITIDPERDTPEVMKAYVSNFGPRMMGLTGTPEQIAAAAKAFRVYYAKVKNSNSAADYVMDHSTIIYLMGPDGRFVKHMTYTTDAAKLAADLKKSVTGSP